jgi:16S rRNA (adenine1518-N6/adenine1519-N6)-dimethyltransferase
VVAVEIDPKLASELEATVAKRAPGVDFTLVRGDAMKVTALPTGSGESIAPDALVANLPYNISVPVLLHFLETFDTIQTGLVLVQAEVAHRLAAQPGSKIYGVPSVKLAWYAESALAGNVGRTIFWPVPNVDSALVYFAKRPTQLGDEALRLAVFEAVDAAFAQRRKTLRQALADWAGSAADAERILLAAGVDPKLRGEQLDIHDFVRIAKAKA